MAYKNKGISNLSKQYSDKIGKSSLSNDNVTVLNITKDFSNKFDTLQVCFISDLHIGSSDFDMKGLLDTLQYADTQENAVIFMLGDFMNSAIIGSKSDAYEDLLNPQEELDLTSNILQIANGNSAAEHILNKLNKEGKIVVVHSGNHEDRITRSVGISPTKVASDSAGVSDAYAPFYAYTDLILRQPKSPNGKFHFGIITHHGTGIHNIDGVSRLLRNADNAYMCVIGHTHQHSIKTDRLIQVKNNEQYYHDVTYMTLPASGGGTYGAGMALPDIAKQSAVWVAVGSEPNPQAGKISPTGVHHADIVPSCYFFTPTLTPDTLIKQKRLSQASRAILKVEEQDHDEIQSKIDELMTALQNHEKAVGEKVSKSIFEKAKKEPKGYAAYMLDKYSNPKNTASATQETKQLEEIHDKEME